MGKKRVAHLSNFLHLFSDKCKSIAKTVSQTAGKASWIEKQTTEHYWSWTVGLVDMA